MYEQDMPVVCTAHSDKTATWSSILLSKVCIYISAMDPGANQNFSSIVSITAGFEYCTDCSIRVF